jgi:tryptophan-rich sensory protein
MNRWLIFLPLGLGFSSTLLSKDLKRAPSSRFQPPGYVFSIVWPLLYLSMGYASYRISKITKLPTVYFVQLLLNFSWSIVYTRLGITPGLINIVLLLFFVMLTYNDFHQIDTSAANILLPYIAWITFATFLNIDVATKTF